MTKRMYGQFCEIYGKTLKNLLWEEILCFQDRLAVSDIAKELKISRPKAYQLVYEFIEKGYLVKDRIIGKTQLYKLNTDHPVVKIQRRNFKECLKMVIDEYTPKKSSSGNVNVGTASARGL